MKRELQQRINDLGPDGAKVIEIIVSRIERATAEYGPMSVKRRGGFWLREGADEAFDGVVYHALFLLWLQDKEEQFRKFMEAHNETD